MSPATTLLPITARQGSTGSESPPKHPYQGFFTERSSSFRKPFCTIHLSLRNLVLRDGGVTEAPKGPIRPLPVLGACTAHPAPLLKLTGAAGTPSAGWRSRGEAWELDFPPPMASKPV
ncbi:hypothetical protein P7K49_032531 [Saguinus oedipus]|uniref:Uncharacterized protein n=1 Tax=Saguinus oedipus TaxID=9490 RepID=A0ABQ9TZA7_SAGOE|nr:hypothetical protein P7K49_032531 [Saguinus oedipus]